LCEIAEFAAITRTGYFPADIKGSGSTMCGSARADEAFSIALIWRREPIAGFAL